MIGQGKHREYNLSGYPVPCSNVTLIPIFEYVCVRYKLDACTFEVQGVFSKVHAIHKWALLVPLHQFS